MSLQYRYCGDEPTVFISLIKNGETWVPSRGDEIELDEPVSHPLLELIIAKKSKVAAEAEPAQEAAAEVEPEETPDDAIAQEEN
jgi:hypothetical protein